MVAVSAALVDAEADQQGIGTAANLRANRKHRVKVFGGEEEDGA